MPVPPVESVTPVEFIRRFGGRRMGPSPDQPAFGLPEAGAGAGDAGGGEDTGDGDGDTGVREDRSINHGIEQSPEAWAAIDLPGGEADDADCPRRFVDGSQIHQTVAWIKGPQGHPVPVELAEVGGVAMRAEGGKRGWELRREFEAVERVVCIIVDPFPWEEIELFAAALAEQGLRLLHAPPPDGEDGKPRVCFDFERMRRQSTIACRHAMEALEEVAWARDPDQPTLVDGRLSRFNHKSVERSDVIGVIKRQHADYLHDQGWRVLYSLEPGQRTPAFRLSIRNLKVVSWFLKLDGPRGSMPNWGIVRVEIPEKRFTDAGADFGYLDRLSRAVLEMRCRRASYGRGPVSLEPIVRAEESLKSLFAPLQPLVQHFYRVTGL